MQKNFNDYSPSIAEIASESLEEYIERKQVEYLGFLTRQRLAGNIDELNLKRLVSEACEGKTLDDVCNHFTRMWQEARDVIKENIEMNIKARLVKGSTMIEKETNPEIKREYLKVYADLLKRLDDLKGA